MFVCQESEAGVPPAHDCVKPGVIFGNTISNIFFLYYRQIDILLRKSKFSPTISFFFKVTGPVSS